MGRYNEQEKDTALQQTSKDCVQTHQNVMLGPEWTLHQLYSRSPLKILQHLGIARYTSD